MFCVIFREHIAVFLPFWTISAEEALIIANFNVASTRIFEATVNAHYRRCSACALFTHSPSTCTLFHFHGIKLDIGYVQNTFPAMLHIVGFGHRCEIGLMRRRRWHIYTICLTTRVNSPISDEETRIAGNCQTIHYIEKGSQFTKRGNKNGPPPQAYKRGTTAADPAQTTLHYSAAAASSLNLVSS